MYRSKYEAYSFLTEDPSKTIACDFEIMTDEVVSKIGHLAAYIDDEKLNDELKFIAEIVYHLNPTLRTFMSVSLEEFDKVLASYERLKTETKGRCEMFVLPFGSKRATLAHVIRNNFKGLSRLAYAQERMGNTVPELLHDFMGLLSNYFFYLSLYLNMKDGFEEIPFESRNYKLPKKS